MFNLAVFSSARGTDLQAIIDAKQRGELPKINLAFVLSDKKDSFALERAKKAGIKAIWLNPKGRAKFEFDQECAQICLENKIDLIMLIGYMRIITDKLIKPFKNKIFNIHPSLLPKYAGGMNLNVHEAVLKNKEIETGCTLHSVTENVDAGLIIKQAKVKIEKEDTIETLKIKVQAKEQEVILKFLTKVSKNFLKNLFKIDSKA